MPEHNPNMKLLRVTIHKDDHARLLKLIEKRYPGVPMRRVLRIAIKEFMGSHDKTI